MFLRANVGSIFGTWRGRICAADQRALLGRFVGKGLLRIDGAPEQVRMFVSVSFSGDVDTAFSASWAELCGEVA